jgi:HlyD family secretion protein
MKANEFPGRTLTRFRYVGSKAAGVLVLGVFIILSILMVATGPKAEPAPRIEREWPVSYSIVTPVPVSPTIQVYGRLESDQQATLRAGITATVDAVVRREGDWVNKGEAILQLDKTEAELILHAVGAALQRAQAALRSVKNEYQLARTLGQHHEAQAALATEKLKRFESLHEQRMIADAQLDEIRHEANERAIVLARHMASLADFPNQVQQADAAVQEAQTRLAQAQLDLAHTDVNAPFSGRILRLEVATGDRISAGSALLHIADYERLQVRAPVPVDVGQRLRLALVNGQPVVASATVAGQRLGFELTGLAGDVKAGQSGIDAFFRVAPDALIALGSVVNLNLALPEVHGVVPVPVHALYDNNRVYLIRDNRLQAVAVERIGEHLDDQGNYRVLVRSLDLNAGDQLMISQLPAAMTGLLVTPTAALAEDAPTLAGQWSSW